MVNKTGSICKAEIVTCNSVCDVVMLRNNCVFSEPSTFVGNIITSIRWTRSAFHKVMWWHLSRVVAKLIIMSDFLGIPFTKDYENLFLTELIQKIKGCVSYGEQ